MLIVIFENRIQPERIQEGSSVYMRRLLAKSSILSQIFAQSSLEPLKELKKSRSMRGTERHRSVHLLDSTVVRTTSCAGRKERTRWSSSSGKALSRSRAEPPPARARLEAAAAMGDLLQRGEATGAQAGEAFLPG